MEIVVLLEGDKVRFAAPEHCRGKHSTYSSTHDGVELLSSDVLNGTDFSGAVRRSEIKEAGRSSADEKHSLTKERKSNHMSSGATTALGDNGEDYTSCAQSDSDDEVSTSCCFIKKKSRRVTQERQPSSRLNHIGICVYSNAAIVSGYLVGAVVGAVAGLTVGAVVGAAVGAGVGASALAGRFSRW